LRVITPDEELPSENNRFTELGKLESEGLRRCQKVGKIVEQESGPTVGVGEALTMARVARGKVSQKSMASVKVSDEVCLMNRELTKEDSRRQIEGTYSSDNRAKYSKRPPKIANGLYQGHISRLRLVGLHRTCKTVGRHAQITTKIPE
jgi:hypothetical protein